MSLEPIQIDGRGLLPPEPMQLTLEALRTLPPRGAVVLLLYREPYPLYEILDARGFLHSAQQWPDGTYAIRIARP